jgi:hypothetical protein
VSTTSRAMHAALRRSRLIDAPVTLSVTFLPGMGYRVRIPRATGHRLDHEPGIAALRRALTPVGEHFAAAEMTFRFTQRGYAIITIVPTGPAPEQTS